MDKGDQVSEPSTSAGREYDAANAGKLWGFKIIPSFDKVSDATKTTVVSHNMDTLKHLPSEIKLPIIKKYIKKDTDDYLGFEYLKFYVRGGGKNVVEHEPKKTIDNKRSSVESANSTEEEETRNPSKKKREEEKTGTDVPLEEINGEITEQENSSRKYFLKNRVRVKYADVEEEEEKRNQPKKGREKGKAREKTVIPMPVPELPEAINVQIVKLNGTDIKWVITKRLFSSDVSQTLGRLSMPLNQIDIGFLTDEEREKLDKREKIEGKEKGIDVGLVGPTGGLSRLVLTKWRMEKPNNGKVTITYNLITGWYKDVVEANGLKSDQLVHVWSFREGNNLWFALAKVDE